MRTKHSQIDDPHRSAAQLLRCVALLLSATSIGCFAAPEPSADPVAGAAGGDNNPAADIQAQRPPSAGDPIKLRTANAEFDAVYYRATRPSAKRAILINPRRGEYLHESDIIADIGTHLAAAGWATLALQQPATERTDRLGNAPEQNGEVCARIAVGLECLRAEGFESVVLLGESSGASAAAACVVDSTPSVVAIVGIGNWRAELDATRLAVLDIVGGRDVKAMANAERRRHQYRTGGMHAYRGIIIPGADRTFRGFEYDVAKTVHGWVAQGPASPRTKIPADM